MAFFLEVTENTLAKLRPKQASELRPGELQPLAKGLRIELQSYAYADNEGNFNGHFKFAIANPEDWLANLSTWYVYEGHARVLQDDRVVYPPPITDPNPRFTLRIVRDTYFKRQPLQAVELSPSELYRVKAGTTFPLQSYAYGTDQQDFNGHIKFALENREINGFNTWFIYEGHAEVLANGRVVYSQVEHETPQTVRIIQDTLLKRQPLQSAELPPAARVPIEAGTELEILVYAYADDEGDFNNHIKFTLARPEDYINGFNTWFVFENDAQVFYDGELVYPQTPPAIPTGITGQPIGIKLPGYISTFYLNEPIIPGGKFTWAEATKNGSRIPATKAVVENILVLAELLERPRRQIGRPFIITSWYRPPIINRMVGGATYSRHLYGQAVDFYVESLPARTVAQQIGWWPGGLGAYSGWVHLDTGPRRRWYR